MATLLIMFAAGVLTGRALTGRSRRDASKPGSQRLLHMAQQEQQEQQQQPQQEKEHHVEVQRGLHRWFGQRGLLKYVLDRGGGGTIEIGPSGTGDIAEEWTEASCTLSDAVSCVSTVQDTEAEAVLQGGGDVGATDAAAGPATPPPRDPKAAEIIAAGGDANSAIAASAAAADAIEAAAAIGYPTHLWYVTQRDLDFFRLRAEQDVVVHGAGPWTHMMDREIPRSHRYSAWRRTLANGITEYRSLTIIPDCSPLEYADFSFDDNARCASKSMCGFF